MVMYVQIGENLNGNFLRKFLETSRVYSFYKFHFFFTYIIKWKIFVPPILSRAKFIDHRKNVDNVQDF